MHYGVCSNCGASGIVEKHHVFFKSKARALKNCNLNLVDLCTDCHSGTNGVHGPHGHNLDIKLKRETQNKLITALQDNEIEEGETTLQGIARILGVTEKEVQAACKNIKTVYEDTYAIEDVVRALQGGKLYE